MDSVSLKVNQRMVDRRRAVAMHLHKRLPAKGLPDAAFGGLQDSAPRSALLSLQARVDKVEPASWEDPSLVQIWFRWADYVVALRDVGVFTLGCLPRDAEQAAALHRLADAMVSVLDGRALHPEDITRALPDLPNPFAIRSACVTGKIHIRWDARSIAVIPADSPEINPEDARIELARRFLRWLGPATMDRFAKWAGIPREDAAATWKALTPELLPVDFEGSARWILTKDESRLMGVPELEGIRLLPQNDPFLYLDAPKNPPVLQTGPQVTSRLVNSLTGRILADGKLVGSWGRSQNNVTLFAWRQLTKKLIERISEEATAFEGPIGKPIRLRWLSR